MTKNKKTVDSTGSLLEELQEVLHKLKAEGGILIIQKGDHIRTASTNLSLEDHRDALSLAQYHLEKSLRDEDEEAKQV